MAGPRDVIVGQLQSGQQLIDMLTKDLSDGEMFKAAAPGTNHPAWLVGHIAVSEDWMLTKLAGAPPRHPQALHDLFKGGKPCTPEAAKYPPRKEIMELFVNQRATSIEAIKLFDEHRWQERFADAKPTDFFPTFGALWALMGTHQYWHIGQLATCRAALGKKPTFM